MSSNEKGFMGAIIGCLLVLWAITFAGLAVQTSRLDDCLATNGQYREQLQCYQDREREIEASISRTERAVSEGVGGLRSLRETLELVEKEYVGMWYLLHNNGDDFGDNEALE